jgi:hypothetical protein
MNVSPDDAWLILRKYADDNAVVFASVVIEGVVTAAVLGRIVDCEDVCTVSGDGLAKLSFPRHVLAGAEYADPREALPLVSDHLGTESLESGLRLDLGAKRWGFILHIKSTKP